MSNKRGVQKIKIYHLNDDLCVTYNPFQVKTRVFYLHNKEYLYFPGFFTKVVKLDSLFISDVSPVGKFQ